MASARVIGTNENISTYGNGTRDYTDLAVWESATDNDLVTATQSEVLECYRDSAVYADNIVVTGAITNSSYKRIIRPASGNFHTGIPNTGVRFELSSFATMATITEEYFSLQDIELNWDGASGGTVNLIQTNATSHFSTIIGCILGPFQNTSSGSARGFLINGTSTSVNVISLINNIIIKESGNGVGLLSNASSSNLIIALYNNTFIDADIQRSGGVVEAKNCLVDGGSFSGTFDAASTNNASSDTSAPGLSPRINQTFSFIDNLNDDYHLDETDSAAKGFGADLSSDTNFAFDDDIDRETIITWSIGADAQAGAPIAPLAISPPISTASGSLETRLIAWERVGQSTTCLPKKILKYNRITISAFGTFGNSASIALEGSPEIGSNPILYSPLTEDDTPIALTASGSVSVVDQSAIWYKPVITGGDGNTNIDIYITTS